MPMMTSGKAACGFFPDQGGWMFLSGSKRRKALQTWEARAHRKTNPDAVVAGVIASWIKATNTAIAERTAGRIQNALKDERLADRFATEIERWQANRCG